MQEYTVAVRIKGHNVGITTNPIYSRGSQGRERLTDSPEVTQLVNVGSEIQTMVV